jgi:hypothetical protein
MKNHVEKAMAAIDSLELDEPNRVWFDFLGGLVTERTS